MNSGYRYGDQGENFPPDFQHAAAHTARTTHGCLSCEGQITPGQQYRRQVYKDDNALITENIHADRQECQEEETKVQAHRPEDEVSPVPS